MPQCNFALRSTLRQLTTVPRIPMPEASSSVEVSMRPPFNNSRIWKVSCCFFSVKAGKREKRVSLSHNDRSRKGYNQHRHTPCTTATFSGFHEEDDPWGVSWQSSMTSDSGSRSTKPETPSISYGRSHEDEFDFDEAQEQLEHCLEQFKARLDDIQIGRQALANFDALPVQIKKRRAASNVSDEDEEEDSNPLFSKARASRKPDVVPLSTVAQVTIRSAALVLVRILNPSDEACITQAIRGRYPTWVVTKGGGEGTSEVASHGEGVVLSLRPPKTTRQVRDQLVARVKECFNEAAREFHSIEEDYVSEIKENISDRAWGAKEIKKLRAMSQEHIQRARKAMEGKIEALLPL